MYAAVLVLAFLVILLLCIKLSFLKLWPCAAVSLIFALFTGLSWPLAIRQSNLGIAAWMNNPALMLDTAVILTVEVFLQIVWCLLAARLMYSGKEKKAVIMLYKILRLFPGVLAFPVLLIALMRLIYAFPGVPFGRVAWIMAAGVFVLIILVAQGVRKLIPEKDIRLELLFMASLLELVIGIVTTVNGTTSFKGSDPVSWGALVAFASLALVCAVAGYIFRKIKIKKYGTDL